MFVLKCLLPEATRAQQRCEHYVYLQSNNYSLNTIMNHRVSCGIFHKRKHNLKTSWGLNSKHLHAGRPLGNFRGLPGRAVHVRNSDLNTWLLVYMHSSCFIGIFSTYFVTFPGDQGEIYFQAPPSWKKIWYCGSSGQGSSINHPWCS